jgi:hypothetical protein
VIVNINGFKLSYFSLQLINIAHSLMTVHCIAERFVHYVVPTSKGNSGGSDRKINVIMNSHSTTDHLFCSHRATFIIY